VTTWGLSGEQPCDYIILDREISAPQLLIPPIMLHSFDRGYHLALDFFRNDWMVHVDDEHTIPVPRIRNKPTAWDTPYFAGVSPSSLSQPYYGGR
jgi:hypothetical protein